MHKHPPPPNPDELVRQFHPNILWTAVTVSTSFAVLYGAVISDSDRLDSSPKTSHSVIAGLFLALAVVSLYLLL